MRQDLTIREAERQFTGDLLKLSKTAGVTAVANGSLIVNSGGTLLLGAANPVGGAVPMTLGGGTFQTGRFSEQLGTLKLTANSQIDLGGSASVLKSDDSLLTEECYPIA